MIRVLYIAEALQKNSGVASVIMNYIENIDSTRIKVDLLTYKGGDFSLEEEIRSYGSNIFYMPELSLFNVSGFIKALKSFFSNNPYDIVHSHFNQVDYFVFSIAKKNGVKYTISHSHNVRLSDSRVKAIRNRIMCMPIPAMADVWAACSEEAGKCLYGKGYVTNKKSLLIRNGVNCEKYVFNPSKRKHYRELFGMSDDKIVLGHVGGFRQQKNHKQLIDIFESLHISNPQYNLVLVGDGELRNTIEKYVEEKKLTDSVLFLGTRSDVSEILNAFDIFILPSLYEGLPVVGIEAQANGLKCVFSDEITKEADLTNCYYFSLNSDAQEWANRINMIDISRTEGCIDIIKNKGFDIKTECKRLSEFYLGLCEG